METIIYYSRNRKSPPYKVTIEIEGKTVYINCDCPLGIENKICRHKINAIRGDKEHKAESTTDFAITRLRNLFGQRTTLRQHLEEKWRMLREYANEYPANQEEIEKKRRILGEAFSNGFTNELMPYNREAFDISSWEDNREIIADNLECQVTLKYESSEGEISERKVNVNEIFLNKSQIYIYGYCYMREEKRTFRVDRIHGLTFQQNCPEYEKSILIDAVFQVNQRPL